MHTWFFFPCIHVKNFFKTPKILAHILSEDKWNPCKFFICMEDYVFMLGLWTCTYFFTRNNNSASKLTYQGRFTQTDCCCWHIGQIISTKKVIDDTCWGWLHGELCNTSGGSSIFQRGLPTSKVGIKSYYSANFPPKLHENEMDVTPPLDPPMNSHCLFTLTIN